LAKIETKNVRSSLKEVAKVRIQKAKLKLFLFNHCIYFGKALKVFELFSPIKLFYLKIRRANKLEITL
jgi:hypothetical protein